ncbi:TIGR00341 family protein [Halomarina pelagica]|uniref:TIGR00341 family protein n=1 Tax=Halomarina pelagica TaxID=2961599 RepID=UPI0020C28077|nr:TIGR00341 family protein [Halomarina sp. BND7]
MRLIELSIPDDKREAVVGLLDDRDLRFTLTDEVSGREYGAVVSVPVDDDAVEDLLDAFRDVGIDRDGYAVVSDVRAVLSDRVDEQGEEMAESGEEPIQRNRISRDELRTQAAEMAEITPNFAVFTVISAVVAAAGLLTDSAAVVVGSMVIAPLLGPAVGASVGSVVNDEDLFREGVSAQALGLVLAVLSATLFGLFAKATLMPNVELRTLSEVASRVNPGALSLVVALGSGAAGALSVSAGASAPLVGVMIAAALIPPAAAVGLGVAYGDPLLVVSASILVLVNVLSINLTSLGVLWLRGYRPHHWFEQQVVRRATLERTAALVLGIALLSSFLVITTADLQRNAAFEDTVEEVAADSDMRVLSIRIDYETGYFSRQPSVVTVRALGASPDAAAELREAIRERTALDVGVVVIRENAVAAGNVSHSGSGEAASNVTGAIEFSRPTDPSSQPLQAPQPLFDLRRGGARPVADAVVRDQ